MTIEYSYDDSTAIANAEFSLYRVAEVTSDVQYVLTDQFVDAPVMDLNNVESTDVWSSLANELSAYAAAEGISADYTGTTDSNGILQFSELPTGLYLLVGSRTEQGDYIYSTFATLIQLPKLDETTDEWDYTPRVEPKTERESVGEEGETIDIVVWKVWENDGDEDVPSEVTIQLLMDGEAYDEAVTLNQDNDWTYTWSELEVTHDWQIAELNVPDGYTVLVSRNSYTFVVTNTYTIVTPTPTPNPTATPSPTGTPAPSNTPAHSNTPAPSETPAPVVTPTPTTTPSATDTPIPSETPVPTETPTPVVTPTPTTTPSATESPNPSETPEPTETPASVVTPTPTTSPSATETPNPTETPSATETPGTTSTPGTLVTPGGTNTPGTAVTPETTTTPTLPQTGQLNWPIPILVISGLLLFAVGWCLTRKEQK